MKCRLLQFLFGALRVKQSGIQDQKSVICLRYPSQIIATAFQTHCRCLFNFKNHVKIFLLCNILDNVKNIVYCKIQLFGRIIVKTQIRLDVKKQSDQGPVVQSIVSLTSSLRGQLVKCFTAL